MSDDHVYIETSRVVTETNCKYFKRFIVGIIRHLQNEEGELLIPEEYFDNVPDDLGFKFEIIDGQDEIGTEIPVRCFSLSKWNCNQQDCGGDSEDIDKAYFSPTNTNKVVHLRLVKSDELKD